MTRRILSWLAVAAILCAALWVHAAQPTRPAATPAPPAVSPAATPSSASGGGIRIGYVDLDRVAEQSLMIKARVTEVERNLRTKQTTFSTKAQELKDLSTKYRQQESVMSAAQKEKLQAQMDKLRDELNYIKYETEKTVDDTSRKVIEPVLDEILQAVERVAQENRIDLVLRGDLVLFASQRVDMTDFVIRELDRGSAPAGSSSGAASRPISPAQTPASRSSRP